ncbi:helix-turn-helix domain-containing protein [Salmonella enterica]|nr:helix-turn-helix domain-containing protein [Salmonella enterica]EIK0388778.1 helix-turn-helix domain-containing protein [Salmonella enterica]
MRLKDLPIEVQINFETNLEGLCVALFGDESTSTLTSESAVAHTLTWPTEAGTTNQLTIGTRIRELRKERQLTQADIAEAVNVSTQTICLWENDNATMSVDKLIPLASALQCDPMWLLSGNTTKEVNHQDLNCASQTVGGVYHVALR